MVENPYLAAVEQSCPRRLLFTTSQFDYTHSAQKFDLQGKFAYAIPNQEAINTLVGLSPLVEIGAGTGYWASLLTQAGADIICYDEQPGFNHWCKHDPYHAIAVGGPEQIALHADRTLFLCWPPMSPMASQALQQYQGRHVAYIGEPEGGCTANDEFFMLLGQAWQERCHVDLPQWYGLHDCLWVYERSAEVRSELITEKATVIPFPQKGE